MARILMIEDAADLRDIFKQFLAEHEVVFALEQAEIEPLIEQVDLVICDYHFNPRLSFEQVREMVGNRKPLILLSGEENKVIQYGGILKLDASKQLKPRITALLQGQEAAS